MGYIFNYHQQIIDITAPQTEVMAQNLANEIRNAEDNFTGMAYGHIADMTGKEDLGGGVITGITIELIPDWQIRFWEGTYTAYIRGGNILGGLGDNPIAYTPGVQVIIVQSASSTLVYGSGGLTQSEHDKLMTGLDVSIPDAVWDEILSAHQVAGSAGRSLSRAEKKAALASIKK
jgi:hypothetical protein